MLVSFKYQVIVLVEGFAFFGCDSPQLHKNRLVADYKLVNFYLNETNVLWNVILKEGDKKNILEKKQWPVFNDQWVPLVFVKNTCLFSNQCLKICLN